MAKNSSSSCSKRKLAFIFVKASEKLVVSETIFTNFLVVQRMLSNFDELLTETKDTKKDTKGLLL